MVVVQQQFTVHVFINTVKTKQTLFCTSTPAERMGVAKKGKGPSLRWDGPEDSACLFSQTNPKARPVIIANCTAQRGGVVLLQADGTKAHALYEKYKEAKTLREAKSLGATSRSLAWDKARGFLSLTAGVPVLPLQAPAADLPPAADCQQPAADQDLDDGDPSAAAGCEAKAEGLGQGCQCQAVTVPKSVVDKGIQTLSSAEIEAFDSMDPKANFRSHFHALVLTEKLILPEKVAYRVLGTALGFLDKVSAQDCSSLAKFGRVATAAFLCFSIRYENADEEADHLEKNIKDRCNIKSKRDEFMAAKATIVEAVGNFDGVEDYM